MACDTGEEKDDRVFINPRLMDAGGESESVEEGCLSLPGINVNVRRPVAISIEATDLDGKMFRLQSEGLAARIWQHEYDHLDGKLILDRMTRIDKLANRKALKQLEANA